MATRNYAKKPADKNLATVLTESEKCKSFVARFGESDADQILQCGLHHYDRIRGDDYFLDCLIVGIGYECYTTWHDKHGFQATTDELFEWLRSNVSEEDLAFYKEKNEITKSGKKQFQLIFGK